MQQVYQPISHRQKKYNNQIYKYLIILVILVVFMGTIGVKMLINLSLFIASKSDNKVTTQDNTSFLLPPTIDTIPDATNSAKIKISGSASSGNKLTLFVNDDRDGEVSIKDDEFETEVLLKKGSNEIYLTIENTKTKEKKESEKYHVIYINSKPKLDISSPHDGDKVSSQDITVSGSTDKDVNITINDSPVVISADQKFQYSLKLNEGENKIKVVATDIAGNQEIKEMTVTYKKEE